MNGFPDTVIAEKRAPILVLGLGNMLLTDDGVGPALLNQLGDPSELREISPGRATSGHESNAGELLSAAQLLDELPDRLFIVGVEPERIATGIGLSDSVQQALSSASDQINCLLAELC